MTKQRKGFNALRRLYLVIGMMGLLVVSVLVYSFQTGTRMATKFAPLIDAAMGIKLNVTTAHLWLEEMLIDDTNTNSEIVWRHLDQADSYAQVMLEGGNQQQEIFSPLEDPDIRRNVSAIREALAQFKQVTRKRLSERKTSAASSERDQLDDLIFETLMNRADEVKTGLQSLMREDLAHFRTTQTALIAAGFLFTLFWAIVLRRYHLRQLKDFDKIKQANETLQKEGDERQQAEMALRKSEAHLRTLFEQASDGIFIADADGNYVDVNTAACKMLGFSREELLRLNIRDLLSDDELRQKPLGMNTLLEGKTILAERNLVRKDGSSVPVEISAKLLPDGNLQGLVRDISERKRTEEELQKSEKRLRMIIETEPECVKILAPNGTLVEMNPAGLSMIEADSLEQVQGQEISSLIVPEHRDAFIEMTKRVLLGNAEVLQFEIIGLKGTRRLLEAHSVPLRDANNRIIGVLGVTRDITERKQAEAKIHKLNLELEQRVRDRTAEIEAINKELEAFSYSVSHDLRAPLRSINGFSQALQEDCQGHLNEAGQAHIARIRNAAEKMDRLIQDMLNLAHITRSQMRYREVSLSEMAEEVADELKKTQPGRKAVFRIQPDLKVIGDAGLLRIFLDNVLSNAWKFTERKPQATIEFGMESGNGKSIYFVKDNGAGFDMTYYDRLFDPFQRLHSDKEFKGTGIGLATAKRIIHRHGGKIWAEAEPETGATFYFTLR